MAKKLPRPPQISVGGVSTPALPIHTLISIKDSMSACSLHQTSIDHLGLSS